MMRRLLASGAAGVLFAACGLVPGFGPTMVQGWSIGQEINCAERVPPMQSCDEIVAMAATSVGLDPSTPGRIHREGGYVASNGDQILSNRSGGSMNVVVLRTPGGDRAVGVFCGIGGCQAGGAPAYRP
jgi:hypothetical protein